MKCKECGRESEYTSMDEDNYWLCESCGSRLFREEEATAGYAWAKYYFICNHECDTLIEITCKVNASFMDKPLKMLCPCGKQMHFTQHHKFEVANG